MSEESSGVPLQRDPYDVVAYPSGAAVDTHPDRLAVMGMLHSLDAAPVESCRVLEIGCNDGSNIIPIAYAIPGGEFVGFDLAAAPVERAQRRVQELGLKNIRIFQGDLMEVDESLGMFDYIIAHGVYAWVPQPVRDVLLEVCRKHLAPNGVVFVSYNALPGGYMRNMAADILMHSGAEVSYDDAADPVQEMDKAFDFLQFIAESRPEGDPVRAMLEPELKSLRKRGAGVVYHDELAPAQRPVLFSQFVAHAAEHGLQYLSESHLPPPNDVCFQPEIARKVKAMAKGDPIAEEQILDFVRMRRYRETLLCHADREVDGDLRLEMSDRFRLSSKAESLPGSAPGTRVFVLSNGMRMEGRHPGVTALMEHLIAAWPQSVPFRRVYEVLEKTGVKLGNELFALVLQLVVSRMIDLHAWAAPVDNRVSERPRASANCRQQAASGSRVVTLLHSTFRLDDEQGRAFLGLLDGTRNRAELVTAFAGQFPDMPGAALEEGVGPTLERLRTAGVLLVDEFE